MSSLEVFTYADQQVRTILIDGEPWFVAADVCDYFGVTNRSRALQGLDDDEKGGTRIDTPGGTQTFTVISESGLYAMLFSLQPTQARGVSDERIAEREAQVRAFKRWVTHEVLPQIRSTGQFAVEMPLSQQLQMAADAARRAEELEALRAIEAPKVEAFDAFMEADGHYTMEAAAKSLRDVTGGMGRNQLFKWLRANKVLMRNNNPYERYAHWFKVVVGSYTDPGGRDHVTHTTHVRPEGLAALRRRFTEETR